MSVAEVEGQKVNLPEDAKPMSNGSIVCNCIFSSIIIYFLFAALKVNILSSYTGDLGVYFHCGWDVFDTNKYDLSANKTWSNHYQQCISYEPNYSEANCDWYNNPLKSGKTWHCCNIITLVSLGISIIGYIFIFITNKYGKLKEIYPSILQKRLFITILFQSFFPTILLLIAIISWFGTNGNHLGCWQSNYILMSYSNGASNPYYSPHYGPTSVTYTHRQIGKSMIFIIIAAILVGIHLLVYINHCCIYLGFGNKKKIIYKKRKRKIKHHGEAMLFEHNYNDGIVAVESVYEGFNDQQIELQNVENQNHVRIESIAEIAPGSDQMVESDMKIDDVDHEQNEYDGVKKWFFESVAVPQNYKQTYYDKLIENGFDNLVVIKYMDNQDLMDIGVDKLGHRKTILIATQKL